MVGKTNWEVLDARTWGRCREKAVAERDVLDRKRKARRGFGSENVGAVLHGGWGL